MGPQRGAGARNVIGSRRSSLAHTHRLNCVPRHFRKRDASVPPPATERLPGGLPAGADSPLARI